MEDAGRNKRSLEDASSTLRLSEVSTSVTTSQDHTYEHSWMVILVKEARNRINDGGGGGGGGLKAKL